MAEKLKDERLAELAERFNVAQFVSFSAGAEPRVRNYRIHGYSSRDEADEIQAAIEALIKVSAGSVNVRSFRPGQDKGNPFEYGITTIEKAAAKVRELAAEGYFTIVNETIDKRDGGVSGVMAHGILEFTPGDTPRGVEASGTLNVSYELGIDLLTTIYGFQPDVFEADDVRVEFSIHPMRVGYGRTHTVFWEIEPVKPVKLQPRIFWPNNLSKHIGDKAFGLLIAHLLGLPVPMTTVIPRAIAPFTFGRQTGTAEFWMRTCPKVPEPGRFTTTYGWHDPYLVVAAEDPNRTGLNRLLRRINTYLVRWARRKYKDPEEAAIASVLAQEGVSAAYSGATLPGSEGEQDLVEGVVGRGDEFMQGNQEPEELPPGVVRDVRELAARARKVLGPVRMEFVHDGHEAWVAQLHLSSSIYSPGVINPGAPENGWVDFDTTLGLPRLRDLIVRVQRERRGVRVIGPVGVTSHVGDLLRREGIPAKLEPRN